MADPPPPAAQAMKVPVTMLSGFLGAGKTTLLRYLLENSGERIACIVNDVASINIDAKLVRNDRNRARGEAVNTTADLADTIELSNGCACCSLQDELFGSFEQVLALADKKGIPYARIVLENSGVAEPQNIRDKFNEAAAAGHPLMARIELDTLVTVVDSGSFLADYASKAPLTNRPELGEGGSMRPVVDLLVEQIECADFVLLNKTDMLAETDQLGQLVAIVSSLNPLASVLPCEQGKVDIPTVFGSTVHSVVAKLNTEGQHRGAVAAALAHEKAEAAAAEAAAAKAAHAHAHSHSHGHGHAAHSHGPAHGEAGHVHDAACTGGHDHHEHSHGHEHAPAAAAAHSHDHGHGHSHAHGPAHGEAGHVHDATCKEGHDHAMGEAHHHHHGDNPAHGHEGHVHDASCAANPAHGHEGHVHDASCGDGHGAHEHHHHPVSAEERPETRAALRFGIRSFVYSRRRPFHPQRLRELVLRWLPVTQNKALEGEAIALGDSPVKSVLRSKGFMWMSNSHSTAYFWSHAGQHFEIRDEGDWWATVPDADWPDNDAQCGVILHDFEQPVAGSSAPSYGDRRQEIVFIGVAMDQAKICEQMDGALLSDDEMTKYVTRWAATPDPAHKTRPAAL